MEKFLNKYINKKKHISNIKGSFNWRMVFPISLPNPDPNITFQIWDKDLLSPNDFISDATFSFTKEATECFEDECCVKIKGKKQMSIFGGSKDEGKKSTFQSVGKENPDQSKKERKEEKFTIELLNAAKKGFNKLKKVGKLTISLEIVPNSV